MYNTLYHKIMQRYSLKCDICLLVCHSNMLFAYSTGLLCHVAECRVQTVWEQNVLAQQTAWLHTVLELSAHQLQIAMSSESVIMVITDRHGPICRRAKHLHFLQGNRHSHLCHVHPTILTQLLSSMCLAGKRKTFLKNGWLIWQTLFDNVQLKPNF